MNAAKKKLVYFTAQVPELSSGSQVRSYHILQRLRKKYAVTVYCVTDQTVDPVRFRNEVHEKSFFYPLVDFSPFRKLLCLLQGRIPYIERYRSSLPTTEQESIAAADILFFSELNGYFVAEKYISHSDAELVFDAHNVEYRKFDGELRAKGFIHTLASYIFTPLFRVHEGHVLRRMHVIYACSGEDADYLRTMAPQANVRILPNGVDCHRFTPKPEQTKENTILFMGSLNYSPNTDGLIWFLEKIYPIIKKHHPHVRFHIVGRGDTDYISPYLQDTSITLQGFVPDVRDAISQAAVCICPLRFGSGTRLKILEYMSMGKPVVSTAIGAEGLDVSHEKNIILANTPIIFSQKIIELLEHKIDATSIGKEARLLVLRKYEWKQLVENI